ncbi:MAG: doxx family protein [Vicingaceae bacterium]
MKIKTDNFLLLSISIGLVYLWFGALKFFPGLSPAEGLAKETIQLLTFGLIPESSSIILLAIIESGIGILLIFNFLKKVALYAALVHILVTFFPIFLFAESMFSPSAFSFTLLGQYIFKNIVYVAALLLLLKVEKQSTKKTKI